MTAGSKLERIRRRLIEDELDAMLVSSPENHRYMSGFTGSAGYLLISQDDAVLATSKYGSGTVMRLPAISCCRSALKERNR